MESSEPQVAASNNNGEASPTTTTTTTTTTTMDDIIHHAEQIIDKVAKDPGTAQMFQHCHGLVIMRSVEVAFLFSGSMGSGILLRHDKKNASWSPPCAIGTTGIGAGLSAGLAKNDIVIFLMEVDMMKMLGTGDFTLRLGTQTTLAVGPLGETFDITVQGGLPNKNNNSNKNVGTTSGFVASKGAFAGVSLQGGVMAPRTRVNEKFYGEKRPPKKILFGQVDVPNDASVKALQEKLQAIVSQKREAAAPAYVDTIPNAFLKKPNVDKEP